MPSMLSPTPPRRSSFPPSSSLTFLVDLDQQTWNTYLDELASDGFEIAQFDLRATARVRQESFAVPPRLRLPDASVLATARSAGASTVATFDEAIRRAAAQYGLGLLPAEPGDDQPAAHPIPSTET